MLKVNSIHSLANKNIKSCDKTNFTSTSQVENNSNISLVPSYYNNIKVPQKYMNLGIINLPFDFKAYCYKMANGQRVVIIPKEGETVVKTYVNTGSMNEPDRLRGISHYIEHNLFNGSEGLEAGEFFGTVNKMGAYTNASTGFAETNYFISSNLLNQGDLENKIKIHASMLERPRFAEDMLNKEKGIVNSEINMILGDPVLIAENATLKKLYNINSTSGDLIAGTTENINNITKQDVLDYYQNNYYPSNMVTVISGEVNPDETIKLVSKYFSSQNKNTHLRTFEELKPIDKTARQDIISDKTTATIISMGFSGPSNNDVKSQIYLSALRKLLTRNKTGRLDKGLKDLNTYSYMHLEKIGSKTSDPQAVFFNIETTEQNSEKVLKRIFEGINSVISNPPTDEEIQIIKKALLNEYSEVFETSHGINNFVGTNIMEGNFDYLTDYENIIKAMNKNDLVDAAKKFLDLNKAVVTVMHPKTSDAESINRHYNDAIAFKGNCDKYAINPQNVKRYKMNNNFDILINDIKTDKSVFVLNYDTELPIETEPATMAVLNEILKEGSIFRDDIEYNNDLNKHGIDMNITGDNYSLRAVSEFSAEDMQKALACAKEVLLNPRFEQKTLDFTKKNIKTILSTSDKNVNEKLFKELFPNMPMGYTKDDILNSIDGVTLNDVKKLYLDILSNSQGRITISAPFRKNPLLQDVLFKEIGELPKVAPSKAYLRDFFKSPVLKTKVLTDTNDKNQAEIVEAFKFKINGNLKDTAAILLLNMILGGNSSSRLFSDLREKQQLAYRVNSIVNFWDNAGIMKLSIGTTTDNNVSGEKSFENVQKAINGFNENIRRIMTEKVSQTELETAKLNLKNRILSSVETTYDKNSSISSSARSLNGPLADNEMIKLIDEITADDIYNTANYIFRGKPTYSILATENTIDANKEFLKSLSED